MGFWNKSSDLEQEIDRIMINESVRKKESEMKIAKKEAIKFRAASEMLHADDEMAISVSIGNDITLHLCNNAAFAKYLAESELVEIEKFLDGIPNLYE